MILRLTLKDSVQSDGKFRRVSDMRVDLRALRMWGCQSKLATGMDIDIDAVGDSQKESARILQSPFHVRHRKLGDRVRLPWGSGLDSEGESHVVILAVKFHDARNSYLRRSLRRDRSLNAARNENDLRKLRAVQNLLMHLFVAAFIAALAAQCVYYHGSGCGAFGRIEMNFATLQFKRAVHSVERRPERELDGAIEFTLGASLHTVHGTFKLKRGEIHFDPAKGTATGAMVVDALSGESGNEGRDKKMHQEILDSPKFSEIVFIPSRIQGTIAPQGTSQVTVSGVMKLHGQDHDMALTFAVQPGTPGQAHAISKFSVPYVKWGLKNPSTFLLRVTDSVDIDVHASGQLTLALAHP